MLRFSLLADVSDLVPLVILLFTGAFGFINFLRERSQAAKMAEEQTLSRGADPTVSNEIEAFLAELNQPNRSQPSATTHASARRSHAAADDFMDDDTPPERVISSKSARQKNRVQKEAVENAQVRPEPSRRPGSVRKTEQRSGGSVRERHIQSQVKEHHLESQVAKQHLTPSPGKVAYTPDVVEPKVAPFGGLFTTDDDVLRAIVMNEVLSKPLSLRKNH